MLYTVVETDQFIKQADKVWTHDERLEFISFLANNPFMGDIIQGSGGLRKIRWSVGNKGKSGGVRVIYFNILDDGLIVCTYLYSKNKTANMTGKQLKTVTE